MTVIFSWSWFIFKRFGYIVYRLSYNCRWRNSFYEFISHINIIVSWRRILVRGEYIFRAHRDFVHISSHRFQMTIIVSWSRNLLDNFWTFVNWLPYLCWWRLTSYDIFSLINIIVSRRRIFVRGEYIFRAHRDFVHISSNRF